MPTPLPVLFQPIKNFFLEYVVTCLYVEESSGGFRRGLEAWRLPLFAEIYHLILVNCKFSEPKYLDFRLFLRGALHPSPERPLFIEISGSATGVPRGDLYSY